MNSRLALASLIVWLLTVSTAVGVPISGPVYYNGHTYYLLSNDTWTGSEADAVTLGGHLVAINDAAENAFVNNTFSTGGPPNLANLWIGLNDAASEGTFVWSNGDPVIYTNWQAGEPNNNAPGPGQDYGLMYAGVGTWDDNIDTVGPQIYGVAEIPQIVVEPATLLLVLTALGVLAARRQALRDEPKLIEQQWRKGGSAFTKNVLGEL